MAERVEVNSTMEQVGWAYEQVVRPSFGSRVAGWAATGGGLANSL